MKQAQRFTMSFTEGEYRKLMDILDWYERENGVRLSRCAMIKHLLFGKNKEVKTTLRRVNMEKR